MKNNQEEIDDVNSQGDAEIGSPAQDQGHGFDNPNFNLLNLTVADGAHNLHQDNTVNLANLAQVQGNGFGVPQINTVNEANQAQGRGNLQDNPVNHEIIARNRGDPQDDTVNHEVPVPVLTQGHDFLQDNAVNQADLAQGHGFEFLAQGHDVLQVNAVNHLGRGQGIMYGIQRNNQDQNNPRARNQNLVELRENLIENVVNEWRHLKSLKVKKADLERRISNKEVLINIITNEENFINNHYQGINE